MEGGVTYNHFLSSAVIGFLHYNRIEVVKVQFCLECRFVIVVEHTERKNCLRFLERRGVPFETQKLAVVLDPLGALRARTELDVNAVDPVSVHDDEGLGVIRRGARSVSMASVEAITQMFEGCTLEKSAIPELSKVRRGRYRSKKCAAPRYYAMECYHAGR
jgi:hypothetical protein